VSSQGQPLDMYVDVYLEAWRIMFLFRKTTLKFSLYDLVYGLRLVVSQH